MRFLRVNPKTLKEQLYKVLSIVALGAYYVPIFLVLFKKLWKDIPILMFSFYWVAGGLINLLQEISQIPGPAMDLITVIYNLLDVPFVLLILYLNTNVKNMKKVTRLLIPVYLFIEIMNGILRGFTDDSFKYFLAVGVLIVIVTMIGEIFYYFQNMDNTDREKATIFLYFAVLFEYASYVIVYIFQYILNEDKKDLLLDNLIIYYASTLLGILIACFGFLSNNLKKKIPARQVPRPHEVLISIID